MTFHNSPPESINSDLTRANPDTADRIFDRHWRTWFTEADVQRLKELGINTVRIPVRLRFLEASRISVLTMCVQAWLLARRTPRGGGRILPQGWDAPSCASTYSLLSTRPLTLFAEGRFGMVEGSQDCRHSRPPRPPWCRSRKPDVCREVSLHSRFQETRDPYQSCRCTSDVQFYASNLMIFPHRATNFFHTDPGELPPCPDLDRSHDRFLTRRS